MTNNNPTLKDIASNIAAGNIPNAFYNNSNTPNEDDATVIITAPPSDNNPYIKTENHVQEKMYYTHNIMNTPTPVPSTIGLSEDSLNSPKIPVSSLTNNALSEAQLMIVKELTPNMTDDERMKESVKLYNKYNDYCKSLIINQGFSPEEAEIAAKAYFKKHDITKNEPSQNIETEPDVAVITIDKTKTDVNDLGLTTEEHKKLERVNKIRLVLVEDMELDNIIIDRPDEEHKADYIRSIAGSLSSYSVPLPMLGDFVTFHGAQIVQMVNAINYEDARIEEVINKKASLIYDKLVNSNILRKYDENGKIRMTYTEFTNKFAYQDIDIALYAILCASHMEETSTSLTCESCNHTWNHTYALKNILQLDHISPDFKERIDNILKYKSNDGEMTKLYEKMKKARRYKSPFSGNIYDLSYPTVARAMNLLKRIDQEDAVMTYVSAIALYLSRIAIYNKNKNSYVEVLAEETDILLDTMMTLSNEDMKMLSEQIRSDLFYNPKFSLHVACPSCHKESTRSRSVENMVFLQAQ
jgi:hypothetical protein